MPMDRDRLDDSYWLGCAVMDPETREYQELGWTEDGETYISASLTFDIDGTAWLEYGEEGWAFLWAVNEDDDTATLVSDDLEYTVTLYAGDGGSDSSYTVWLCLDRGGDLLWFF